MKRFSFLTLITALGCLSLFPSPLAAQSRQPDRKKVGVVLSGGGAKGMAHIGALKVIEKAGIPIDYVVGTSMGSIIGGLYAIGYSPEQLDSMVRRQDWTFLLSDKTPRSEQNLAEREASEKYVISIPFGKDAKAEVFGGLIKGQNLANLFSELTVGYHEPIDFNKLPIPFACVSENIVNGSEVNFHSGVLATAMRASMAIPGVFTPVRLDSMVLVDGGVVNNYPVNVARAMGADIIIGVDVQSDLKPAADLTSAGSILGQLINLMGLDLYKKNLKETNTYIKVNVEGYSAASFTPAAIDTLIQRGEAAALAQENSLMALKHELGLDSTYMPKPLPAYPYSPNRKVYVKEITFNGLDEKDKKWLLKRCALKEDSEISIRRIEEATAILCANLGYSSATYNLPDAPGGGYNLNYTLSKKYENKLNLGIRFDSEEIASLLINVTSNFRGKVPSSLSLTGRLGKRYMAGINYSLEPAPLKRFGLSYQFQYNDINYYHYGDRTHNSTFRYHQAEFSFSDVWYKNVRFALGLRYELYDYDKFLSQEQSDEFNVGTEHFFTYFAQMQYETFDKAYFPSRGISARASYSVYTDNFTQYNDRSPFSAIKGYCEGVVKVTNRFSILPSVYGRFLIGRDIPYSKLNAMGGDVPSRFLSQELPFVGINSVELMDNSLLIGCMKFRQRMGSVHYVTLTGNYALSSHKVDRLLKENTMFGCGIGYGLDSMFGPLEASLNYANRADKVSMYVNLGFKF
ncbi:patatin-like phospholipase family protein [Phocaeicola sp.]